MIRPNNPAEPVRLSDTPKQKKTHEITGDGKPVTRPNNPAEPGRLSVTPKDEPNP